MYLPLSQCTVESDILPLQIGEFTIKEMSKSEREFLFGISEVVLDTNGLLKSVQFNSQTHQNNLVLDFYLAQIELMKLWASQYLIFFEKEQDIELAKNLLLTLRLCGPGDLFAPVIFTEDAKKVYTTGAPIETKGKNLYHLSRDVANQVNSVFDALNKLDSRSGVYLSLERYRFAISKVASGENSFIEFVSILESLFLDNDRQEVRFRFSLVISFILSNELKIPISFEEIRQIYDTRSELIHSGKSTKYTKADLAKLYSHTRNLLVWYLKKPTTYTEIEEKIFDILKIRNYERTTV